MNIYSYKGPTPTYENSLESSIQKRFRDPIDSALALSGGMSVVIIVSGFVLTGLAHLLLPIGVALLILSTVSIILSGKSSRKCGKLGWRVRTNQKCKNK